MAQVLLPRPRAVEPPGPQLALVSQPWAGKLVAAAFTQIGKTIRYDPAYVSLGYPMGDIPREAGVCSDVVIRAYRDAFGIDLQKLVHEDMSRAFGDYPKKWGLKRPDRNIDHRRVYNLNRYLRRAGYEIISSRQPADFKPGDIVSQLLPGNLTHIVIVSDRLAADGITPMVIHNIGAGTRLENRLFDFEIIGHFRMPG
ncbi:MAG: DUF1287 domain-containing protein [Planctomycetaceae bacterium]|nr:DUF1287 domain-containing protein [Planctomycetaceae bacterium]